jgi:hypothetical protein
MAGTKPKFKLVWTKKDNKSETVSAATYQDVYDFFKKKNAAKQEWGRFHPEGMQVVGDPARGEPILGVTLKIGYTIFMPTWAKRNAATKKEQAAWDAMLGVLAKHEDSHRIIMEKQISAFQSAVEAETDLSNKKLGELVKQFTKDLEAAQDDYDTKSGHGVKEGVFLPAPDEVNK